MRGRFARTARVAPFTLAAPFTLIALAALAALLPRPAAAQRSAQPSPPAWSFHAGVGVAVNAPLPLAITQAGEARVALTAHWSTRPFRTPLYYVARIEHRWGDGALALEWIHHKIFLENAPPEVQHFEISHGFNVVTIQRAWALPDGLSWRAGAGVVVAHPEATVRNLREPRGGWGGKGYYLAGPAAELGAGWSTRVAGRTRIGIEAKLIGAHASVPVANGTARLWNASGHLELVASQGF